ncbi:MAG: hypothetical protein WBL97_19190 [Candidatus Sulfotelmatobacter sp.]
MLMQCHAKDERVIGVKWATPLLLALLSVPVAAQTSAPPDSGQTQLGEVQGGQVQYSQAPAEQPQEQSQSGLADAARKAREEREQQRANRTADSDAVNAMAAELAEGSEQTAPAPVGYRWYSFKAGDYSILVPADAEVEGRNSYGLKLLSSEAMGSRTLVILGDPIPAQGATPDEMLNNAASRYFYGCRTTGIITAGQPVNGHPAGSAGSFSLCPLHNDVLGFVQLVVGDGFVMPVVCGYPLAAEDLHPSPNRPIATVIKGYDRQANGYRACNTILPSLRFNEHGSQWHSKTEPSPPKKVEVTNALLNSNSAPSLTEAQEGSLAAVARAQPKKAPTEVITEIAHAAPGYSSYGFPYCSKDRCFRASLQVPIKARKDEQFQTAYTGLFEFQVPVGDTTAVIQASTGAPTKLGFLTREQFINTKIDWWIDNVPAVYFSGAGKAEVYSEQLTELSGMPARLATFRSPTAFQSVVTQQAAYMAPGVFVQIRCSVPEKAYADARDMCEHVVRSLEVPLQEGTP